MQPDEAAQRHQKRWQTGTDDGTGDRGGAARRLVQNCTGPPGRPTPEVPKPLATMP